MLLLGDACWLTASNDNNPQAFFLAREAIEAIVAKVEREMAERRALDAELPRTGGDSSYVRGGNVVRLRR